MSQLTIYTQNCSWWPVTNRKKYFKQIGDFIEAAKPDIVFLQEVFYGKWVKWFDIEGYNTIYKMKKVFLHGGLVILVRKNIRFEPQFAGLFRSQFNARPLQFLSSLAARRGFLHIYLPDFNVHLINAHLTAGFSQNHKYNPARFMQVSQLREYTNNVDCVVFGGDLNFHEDSPEHYMLQLDSVDISSGVGTTFPGDDARYDYIFAKNLPLKLVESHIIPWYEQSFLRFKPIDHHGIMCTIRF